MNPHGEFMTQMARNLTNEFDGFLRGKRYLILDRDTKFTEQFRNIFERNGVSIVRIGEYEFKSQSTSG